MKSKQTIFAVLGITALIFSLVLYTSCRKKIYVSTDSCANVVCKNGGICTHGTCSCPNGYEDDDCGTASLSRYIGTWQMHDSVIGSDHPSALGTGSIYNITIDSVPGTSTRFYLNGITGNMGFSHLPCKMEDTLTRIFTPFQFRSDDLYGYTSPDRMIIVYCIGVVNGGGYYIHGRYVRQYPLADSTVQNDTLIYNALKQ